MDAPKELRDALEVMQGFPAPWCVAGGWAIDLYLGTVTRPHKDVDFALFRDDQDAIHAHFRGWRIRKVVQRQFQDWPPGEWLAPPVHEIHIQSGERSVEFLLNDRAGEAWVFRRNNMVTRPVKDVMCAGWGGVPILAPAIVLLYKAKDPRRQDEDDFERVRDALAPEDRRWLKDALECAHPGHPWSRKL